VPELNPFSALDWSVVAAVLVSTTIVGALLGKHASLRDYFLGGRKLPWWVVSASIIATEISAVTMVAIPWTVFRPGGDMTSLQLLIIGSILARCAIAWKLVPLYFQREVYSPYDVIGERLGEGARRLASAFFVVGNVLSQGARVYLTGLVFEVVLHDELQALAAASGLPTLAISIGIVSLFAVAWTWIGGISAVVWTDFVLLLVFVVSAVGMLVVISNGLDLGFERVWLVGIDSHRFRFLDFDTNPARAYTFWAAAIASSFGNFGAYGVDQMIAQRLLCCRDARDARKAILFSSLAMVVTVLVAVVGVALFAWYERHAMSDAGTLLMQSENDRIVPIFAMEYLPEGMRGLVIAGILAAAISTLDSALGALSQTTVSAAWMPWMRWRARRSRTAVDSIAEERSALRASRAFVLLYGLLLGALGVALQPIAHRFGSVLDLALSMPGYTRGALLAAMLLVLVRAPVDGSGFLWAAPISALWVFCCAWHGPKSDELAPAIAFVFAAAWIGLRALPDLRARVGVGRIALQTAAVSLALLLCIWVGRHGEFWWQPLASDPGRELSLAFPWFEPAGCVLAFVLAHLLSRDVPVVVAGGRMSDSQI
jgi:Na+/proline symporter